MSFNTVFGDALENIYEMLGIGATTTIDGETYDFLVVDYDADFSVDDFIERAVTCKKCDGDKLKKDDIVLIGEIEYYVIAKKPTNDNLEYVIVLSERED